MPRPLAIKDHLLESRLFLRRSIAALVTSGLLLLALIGRLIYLQVFAYEHYKTLSEDNRIKIQAVPPNRGLIYDRNGILLADNLPSHRLEITPEQVTDMDATLERLGKLIHIRDIDLERFERAIARMNRFEGVPLRFHLSPVEVARFAVNRHLFPGVDIHAGLSRFYPAGTHASHAVGYVGRINETEVRRLDPSNYRGTTHTGKVGIERTYENVLHGKVGYEEIETNAQGRTLRVLDRQNPVPGASLYLSLDSRLQITAETAFGDFNGSAVAIDPRSGEVLMLVSLPGYDPNPFVNGIELADYQALKMDEKQPLFNRALRGQYPPGSTLKPFVGLAGLELGITTLYSKTFCPGFYTLPGSERKYRDWKRWGHGTVDLDRSIIESCDVYFYDLARSLGIDRMHDYLIQFGLGKRTGIDIQGELPGLMPSSGWKRAARNEPWYPGETLISGIGQGFDLTTPVQLAVSTAALATYGQIVTPRVVKAVRSPGADTVTPVTPPKLDPIRIAQRGNWSAVIQAMKNVVHGQKGTARRIAEDLSYSIAGKTGTAQVFGLKEEEKYNAEEIALKLRDHSLFIAFAPVEDPRIALAVIVENGGSGSAVAAPLARQILDRYFEDSP